jgi:hypothetical protein
VVVHAKLSFHFRQPSVSRYSLATVPLQLQVRAHPPSPLGFFLGCRPDFVSAMVGSCSKVMALMLPRKGFGVPRFFVLSVVWECVCVEWVPSLPTVEFGASREKFTFFI